MSSSTSTSELRTLAQRALGAAVAVLVLLVAMEGVLRLLPTPSGPHRENPSSAASSARFVRNDPYTFSLGWDLRHVVQGRTNAMGFLSPHEYRPGTRAIALLGDSFAEGEMLSYGESLAGRLEADSGGRVTPFNFGLSGAALPHYLGIAREMGSHFQFDGAVIVVVQGDYLEGFLDQEGLYKWNDRPGEDVVKLVPASPRAKWKQVARESALLHYLRENLKFNPASLLTRTRATCEQHELGAIDRQRLARYVDALPRALRLEPERIVLVFQSNTKDIYEHVDRNRTPAAASDCMGLDALALNELRVLAAARGMKIVESGEVLEQHYRRYRRPLDFRPVDPHWNGLATSVIAAEIGRRLGWQKPVPATVAKASAE